MYIKGVVIMSKVFDGVMGFIIGDALGVPYEFKERGSFHATDMRGYGIHAQPPGTWSDDSSLVIATMNSIIKCRGIDLYDMLRQFQDWLYKGNYTPYGESFDVGNMTKAAIEKYTTNKYFPIECGGASIHDNGNGSLMRILPLAFIDCSIEDIRNVSSLTHAHRISKDACEIYVKILRNLLNGVVKEDYLKSIDISKYSKEFRGIQNIKNFKENDIASSVYVVDSLEAALWSFLTTDNYKDCVLTAVNLGGDTDTIGALSGALAGIYYGANTIPQDWQDKLVQYIMIKNLCNRYDKLVEVFLGSSYNK